MWNFQPSSNISDESEVAMRPLIRFVDVIYADVPSFSPLRPTLLALAWATGVPFASMEYSMAKARKKYAQAISSLRIIVQDPKTASTDDTLLAVLLQGWIEVQSRYHRIAEKNRSH